MEGLGVAANIIAVVEISAKVATLCVQYSTAVASARADIARLQTQVSQLGAVLQAAKRLTEGPKGQSLSVSQELTESLRECIAELQRLDEKLAPSTARKAMRRVGLRALKWPFTSKETRDIVDNLERYEKAISLGLQIDQTFLLLDIQEGIKDLQLNSVTTSSDARKTHFVIPFPRDPHCVDRPPIWSWLKEQYASTATRIALVGMGGFGKSQMAIRFAHDVHAESPDTSVFWVHASTKETFKESYQSIADILALPDRHNPSVNVLALVRDWLQRENLGPWLMIVDNADDVEMLFMANKSSDNTEIPIASYLPKTGNGKILVTSRSWDAAEKLTGSGREILRVQTMEEAQALQLFRNKLGQDVDEPSTLELIHRLDCIPLAVSQAAAYIFKRGPRVTVRSYLDDFQKSERRKGTLLRSDRGDLRRYEGMSNSVMVTWQMTFEQIRRERPRAAKLLSLMSCFHAQNIPEYMLHDYAANYADPDEANGDQGKGGDDDDDDDQFQNDMEVLQSYSLVTPTVCATAKAKCLRTNPAAGSKCDRCDRLGKECAEKLPKTRKKRQSKPSKTAQIEERLNGLVRLLQASGDLPVTPADETLLAIYREHLMQVYPFVIISKGTSATDLAANRPFLMSCIRMITSFRSLRSMQAQMYLLMSHIADRMLIRSERSLDLLAGIVLILGWHHYHCTMHTQMNNLVSLAATLAAELGLKRKPCWHERTRLMVMDLGAVKERTSDEKRLLLAAWYLNSCVSTGFQQIDPMRFSPYMEQCLRELEQAREAESDEYLVQLIRMQMLAEKVAHLNLREEVDGGSDAASRAPLSGYVSVFRTELDRLRANMPAHLRDNLLIKSHLNIIRIRLYEPPILDATLLTAISKSLTTDAPMPVAPSHLDAFYQSNAALKAWYEDWLSVPVSSYYCLPMPGHLEITYVVTILGRWAKLAAPGTIRPVSTALPPDPSGSWNNPANDNVPPLLFPGSQLVQAVTTLKTQLATQPGLELDVTAILGALGSRIEQVSDLLAAGGSDPQAWERNIWARSAIKLKIAQLKLEQFAAAVAEEAGEQEEDDEEEEEGSMQADCGRSGDMAGATGFGNMMEGWTDDVMANMGWSLTGDLYENLDPLLWGAAGGMST
ncbi:hypothetical protein ACHAQA_002690 [Verticillium albo-atrum]